MADVSRRRNSHSGNQKRHNRAWAGNSLHDGSSVPHWVLFTVRQVRLRIRHWSDRRQAPLQTTLKAEARVYAATIEAKSRRSLTTRAEPDSRMICRAPIPSLKDSGGGDLSKATALSRRSRALGDMRLFMAW